MATILPRRFSCCLFVLPLFVWSLCFIAATDVAAAPKSKGKKRAKVAETTEAETSPVKEKFGSMKNRKDKRAYIAAEIGLTIMPITGAKVGFFVSPQMLLEAGYYQGKAGVLGYDYQKKFMDLRIKWFVANSFYVVGGFGMEQWYVEYPVNTTDSTTLFSNEIMTAEATNTGLEIHIGNQWQFSSFTLGCDWAGFFLAASSNISFSDNDKFDPDSKENAEKKIKKDIGGSSPHFVRFYLGWAF
jgi:hypothetical protein